MKTFSFVVPGKPAAQGSKRLLGKVMVESSKAVKPWRALCGSLCIDALPLGWYAIMGEPMRVRVDFTFKRPKHHLRTNGELKPKAPDFPAGRVGDVDKLSRALLDACTGIAWDDDSQVVDLEARKRYGPTSHTLITIRTLS